MKGIHAWPGLVALLATLICGCAPRGELEILYFYNAVCPSCNESRRMLSGSQTLASFAVRNPRARVRIYDVLASDEARDAFIEAIDRYRVPSDSERLPLLIVNGVSYAGSDEVERAIASVTATRR